MEKLEITVAIKTVYGEDKIYPVCVKSHLFAELVKQKTLTLNDIGIIKRLGYTVEVYSNHDKKFILDKIK